jgi:CHAT domain-containing protein/tetratricopeptide (TPR) repeat protein
MPRFFLLHGTEVTIARLFVLMGLGLCVLGGDAVFAEHAKSNNSMRVDQPASRFVPSDTPGNPPGYQNVDDSCQQKVLQVNQERLLRIEFDHGDAAIVFSMRSSNSDSTLSLTSSSRAPIKFFFVAPSPGNYRFEFYDPQTHSPVQVRCRVTPIRAPTPSDGTLSKISGRIVDGDNLAARETASALTEAVSQYRTAVSLLARQPQSQEASELLTLALTSIGKAENDLNRAKTAILSLERAVVVGKNTADLATYARALSELARSYLALGNPAKAIELINEATRSAQSSGDSFAQAATYQGLADLHYEVNDYEEARKYAQESLSRFRLLGNRVGYAHALITLGLIASDLTDSAKAIGFFSESLATSTAVNYRVGITESLTYWGHLCAKEGRLQEAIEFYLRADDQSKGLGDKLKESWITSGLAYVYDQGGDSSRALEYYRKTLTLRTQVDNLPAEASIYKRLGITYSSLKDFDQAAFFFQKAARLYEEFKQWRFLSVALRDLGVVYEKSGQYAKAADYYSRSRELTDKAEDPRGLAYLIAAQGRLQERDSKMEEALESYSEALKLHRAVRDRRGEAEAMFRLAMLTARQGNSETALAQLEEILKIDELFRSEIRSPDLQVSYRSDVDAHYESYIDLLMRLSKSKPHSGLVERALEATEKARARSLLDSLNGGPESPSTAQDLTLKARADQLKKLTSEKANRRVELVSTGTVSQIATLDKEINQLSDEYERIQSVLRSRSRGASAEWPKTLTANEIREQLANEDTVLLEYALGDERSYLWAVTKSSIDSFELPSRNIIERAAKNFYDLLSSVPKTSHDQDHGSTVNLDTGATLGAMILGPVAAQLAHKRVVIVADGALHLVPFGALKLLDTSTQASVSTNGPDSPLISSHEIVYLPSASVLSLLRQTPTPTHFERTIAVIADPVFSADDPRLGTARSKTSKATTSLQTTRALRDSGLLSSNGNLQRLAASRVEADAIMDAAGGNGMKATGFDANLKVALSPALKQYRLIHLATHGVLDTQRPSLSGIVLSLIDDRGVSQPGYLRVTDISTMSLTAELVTLSACQTALGREFKGEGMLGLSRAFMQAGTKRVVASLWKVDDFATAELMTEFYRGMLNDGLRPAEALRRAQTRLREQKRWRAPYFWAGFILQGEWK